MEANSQLRPTNLPKLTPKLPQIKPKYLNFTSSSTLLNPRSNPIPLLLARCSVKPNPSKQKVADEIHSSAGPLPDSRDQSQATPDPGQALSPASSSTRGLVFGLGATNSWDNLEIGSPVVKRYLSDEEERWHMWYHGRSGENPDSDFIGLAVSSNGIHWERGTQGVRSNADVGLVMGTSQEWWAFDTHSIRPCEVVIMSSNKVRANSAVYWLYYTGYCSEFIENLGDRFGFGLRNPDRVQVGGESGDHGGSSGMILKSLPGLAISQDGRHWARIEGEHHSGALLDVGLDGEWDSSFLAAPQVVFHSPGDLRMYYHSFDAKNGQFGIGLARSRDGMRWVKLGKVLSSDELGIVNPRVTRDRKDGKYLMVYEGVGVDGSRSIGVAVSLDGLKEWRKVQESPVFERSPASGWDSEGVGMPCLVQMDGDMGEEWRMYYRGLGKGGRTGIGLAVCQGSEIRSFQRWSGFHF